MLTLIACASAQRPEADETDGEEEGGERGTGEGVTQARKGDCGLTHRLEWMHHEERERQVSDVV